jgi:hypothetical protein
MTECPCDGAASGVRRTRLLRNAITESHSENFVTKGRSFGKERLREALAPANEIF